jgi:pimeloyl-ACP methyl ester carboxylesterase
MPSKRLSVPISHPQRFDFQYEYEDQTINYSLWTTSTNHHVTNIVFLGTVQIGKIPFWVAQQCPPGTVVVQGAPHWLAKDDGSDIPDFMFHFTREVFANILDHFETKKLRVVADSQSVPAVLRWFAEVTQSSVISQLALLQPLGLNTSIFSGMSEDRVRLFRKRIAKNFQYQLRFLLVDRRLLHNHRQIVKIVGYDNPKLNAQYGRGLIHDAAEDLKKISTIGIKIVIICGEKDMIFPPEEIKSTIQKSHLKIPVITIPRIPHSPLATRHGMQLLNKAFEYFKVK